MRMFSRAVAITAAAVLASGTWAVPAHAVGKTSDAIGAKPAAGSSLASGGWYLLTGEGGASFSQSVTVTNTNSHAVEAHIDAADGLTSDHTGTQLTKPGNAVTATGRWITVSTPVVTLQPKEVRNIPFTVLIPKGTSAGQYLGGLNIYVPLTTHSVAPPAPKNGASLTMDMQFVDSIGVEVDVPGPRAPKLLVSAATPSASPQGIVLGLHMANEGNAFAHGTAVVRVADTNTDKTFNVETFVPGTAIVYPMIWTKSVVPGSHKVQVDITYEGGRRTTWSGVVNVDGAALGAALRNVQLRNKKNSDSFPWLLLVAALLLLGFITGAVVMRRRARRPAGFKYQAI
jgi:hypothetical protein